MHCIRCQGLMVQDLFFDYEGTSGHTWSANQRCVNCGQAHDPVIEQNRMASLKKMLPLPAGEPDCNPLFLRPLDRIAPSSRPNMASIWDC